MKLFYMSGASALADHIVLEWSRQPYEAVPVSYTHLTLPTKA